MSEATINNGKFNRPRGAGVASQTEVGDLVRSEGTRAPGRRSRAGSGGGLSGGEDLAQRIRESAPERQRGVESDLTRARRAEKK